MFPASKFCGRVSHVVGPQKFHVRPQQKEDCFLEMRQNMYKLYRKRGHDLQLKEGENPDGEQIVILHDGNFYRLNKATVIFMLCVLNL